jgi:hypothetical protein
MNHKRVVLSGIVFLFLFAAEAMAQPGANWPQWRGPNRDGISKESGLLKQWPAEGPPLVWKAVGAGRGYSSFSVASGKLYTLGLRGDREFVIAFDIANGKEAWATAHGGKFENDRGDGPRGTPTVDGDRVYALGGNGDLSALDARTGKIVQERAEGVWRLKYPMGHQRIAARDGQQSAGERRRTKRFDRGAEQEQRQRDVEEPERRSRVFVGDSVANQWRHSGRVLHSRACSWSRRQ